MVTGSKHGGNTIIDNRLGSYKTTYGVKLMSLGFFPTYLCILARYERLTIL